MPKPLPEYLTYFLSDCLEGSYEYTTKRMFGGYAVYFRGKIFALYFMDALYFKVGNQNRQDYIYAGAKQFTYDKKGKSIFVAYYVLPEEILENREELQIWIAKALDY